MENEGRKAKRQRTDVGKYSFVNRTIADWNQPSEEVISDCHGKSCIFRKRIRKVLTGEGK